MAEHGKINPIEVEKYLKGIDYPTSKQTLLNTAREHHAPGHVISALERIPDQQYAGPPEISKQIGKTQ